MNAATAPAIWRPQLCALTAIAEPAPKDFSSLRLAQVAAQSSVAAEYIARREWHLVLSVGGQHLRLWVRGCETDNMFGYSLPADANFAIRHAATHALHHGVAHRAPGEVGQPGASERWRLGQWLRLLDGLEAETPARQIAATLILPAAHHLSASEWDNSNEKRRMARWQRAALALRDGGYRRLLSGR